LKEIHRTYAAISFTITTADDELARKIEPGAPSPSKRLEAIRKLSKEGILTGVTMMPILPFLEDNEENITQILMQAKDAGASYIIPAFGMSLRTGSRDYYYEKLDQSFPGLRQKYEKQFGLQYQCPANHSIELEQHFQKRCDELELSTRILPFSKEQTSQLKMF
jgi:DNA repair photolyase